MNATEQRLGQFLLLLALGHIVLGLAMPFVLPLLPGVLAQMPYADAWLCWEAGFPIGIVLDAVVSAMILGPALWLRQRFAKS